MPRSNRLWWTFTCVAIGAATVIALVGSNQLAKRSIVVLVISGGLLFTKASVGLGWIKRIKSVRAALVLLFIWGGMIAVGYGVWPLTPRGILAIDSTADTTEYPPGILLSGISWRHEYAHVLLNLRAEGDDDLTDVDLSVEIPGGVITGIGQNTNFPGVAWFPAVPSPFVTGSATIINKNGEKQTIPMIAHGIQAGPVFRIHCDRILKHTAVQLVIAWAVQDLTPGFHPEYKPKTLPYAIVLEGGYREADTPLRVRQRLDFRQP